MKKGGGALRTQKLLDSQIRETQNPSGSIPYKDLGRQLPALPLL